MKMNDAIDMKAEVFVQVGVEWSAMFDWMVDVHVDRSESVMSQQDTIHMIAAVCNRVYNNITQHAHGYEPLTKEASAWLGEYWKDIQRLRK